MRFKLICCEVFMRAACLAIANSQNIIDPEFTILGAHEAPELLKKELQQRINDVDSSKKYDAILLGYGLCGNATNGLRSGDIPLVIPRAHDCCTIFMGSKAAFLESFQNMLSTQWSAAGYMERENGYLRNTDTGKLLGLNKDYEELVEKYGEENAVFIWETLHPMQEKCEMFYIQIPELAHLGHLDRFRSFAQEQGQEVHVLEGNMRLLTDLMSGGWKKDEFLVVPSGKKIVAVFDHEKIIEFE